MGKSHHDSSAAHRQIDTYYGTLSTTQNVRKLLKHINLLQSRAVAGEYASIDMLVDLGQAIHLSKLTYKQKRALYLVYIKDLTFDQAAEKISIRRQSVYTLIQNATNKIADIYFYWENNN